MISNESQSLQSMLIISTKKNTLATIVYLRILTIKWNQFWTQCSPPLNLWTLACKEQMHKLQIWTFSELFRSLETIHSTQTEVLKIGLPTICQKWLMSSRALIKFMGILKSKNLRQGRNPGQCKKNDLNEPETQGLSKRKKRAASLACQPTTVGKPRWLTQP